MTDETIEISKTQWRSNSQLRRAALQEQNKAHELEKQLDETKAALREIRDLYDDRKSVGELATLMYDARCIAIRVLNAHEDNDE